jgi:hypothetical protein
MGWQMKFVCSVTMVLVFIASVAAETGFAKLSKSVEWYARAIAKTDELVGWSPYCGYTPLPQVDYYKGMRRIAGPGELIALTDHHSPMVRCYAFMALAFRGDVDLFPIVLAHLSDTETVHTLICDRGSYERVGDIMIETAVSHRFVGKSRQLDSLQRAQLDSVLVFVPNELDAREEVLVRIKPHDNWYTRIREMVIREHHGGALIALAKYRRPQDIALILSFLDSEYPHSDIAPWPVLPDDSCRRYAYRAIEQFPHEDFLPELARRLLRRPSRDRHCYFENRPWLSAVAAFENVEAANILTQYCRPDTGADTGMIRGDCDWTLRVLQDHLVPPFEDLMWRIWEQRFMVLPKIMTYLAARDSARAFHLTVVGMHHPGDFFSTFRLGLEDSTLFANSWDLIRSRDQAMFREYLREYLRNSTVSDYRWLSSQVQEHPDSSFIEPLFERLASEDNPNTYLEIVKALLSYDDPAINRRILMARQRNYHLLKGWGGRELAFLLRNHGIHWRRLYE